MLIRLRPVLVTIALLLTLTQVNAQPQTPAAAPATNPILDAPLTPAIPVGYQFWLNNGDAMRAEIVKWYTEANGRAPATSDVQHGLWRALYEGERWRTLRAALQNTWPKPGQTTYEEAVKLIDAAYLELLFRAPDPFGLSYYSARLMDGRLDDAGMRADIKASPEYAIKHPVAGAPRLGPITKRGSSFVDGNGQEFNGIEATLFWGLWAEKFDPAKLDANLSSARTYGIEAVRFLTMVGGASWADRVIDPTWPDYWQNVDNYVARLKRHGLLGRPTVFAAADVMMPSSAAREQWADAWAARVQRERDRFYYIEAANEYWGNGIVSADELRALTKRINDRTDVLVTASSPSCGSYPEGNDQSWAADVKAGKIDEAERRRRGVCQGEWRAIYGSGAADLITQHFDRDSSKSDGYWRPVRQPWEMQFGAFELLDIFTNGEPIGPQSSVYSDTDPERLAMAAVVTYVSKGASYTLHTGAGVRGGGQADLNLGRAANLWEVPNIAATTSAITKLRAVLPPLANCRPIPAGQTNAYVLSVTPAAGVVRSYQTECSDGSFVATAFGVSQPVTLRMQRSGNVTLTAYKWDGSIVSTYAGDAGAAVIGPVTSSVVVVGRR